jgi:hypothetical protein
MPNGWMILVVVPIQNAPSRIAAMKRKTANTATTLSFRAKSTIAHLSPPLKFHYSRVRSGLEERNMLQCHAISQRWFNARQQIGIVLDSVELRCGP